MDAPCLIYDDPREIEGVYYPGEDGGCYRKGNSGVTRIVAYREHGQGDFVPYFAIYRGDEIAHRVPASFVEVGYVRADPTPAVSA